MYLDNSAAARWNGGEVTVASNRSTSAEETIILGSITNDDLAVAVNPVGSSGTGSASSAVTMRRVIWSSSYGWVIAFPPARGTARQRGSTPPRRCRGAGG